MITLVSPDTRWTVIERVSFRFFFVFFGLFIIVENNGAFPFFDFLMKVPTELLQKFVVWLGENVLKLPYKITYFTAGSGDTTYDYVLLLCCFVTALISCVVWSLVDRKNNSYPVLYYWLTVAIRFYVGMMLINYGLIKVFKLQFPNPYLNRLLQPYGESSPMGLAWTFLGFSKGYNFFMGIAEVAAGLLLFRRTMTFAAVITLMTTANVMAVNYFYDVPVKILSTALFVFTFFLLARDIKRLLQFFFSGNAVSLPLIVDPYRNIPAMGVVKIVVKSLLILYIFVYGSFELYDALHTRGDLAPRAALYGVYDVKSFVVGHDTLPPVAVDNVRWRRLAIGSNTGARIFHMKDSLSRCFMKLDSVKRTLEIRWAPDTSKKYRFTYEKLDSVHYHFRGILGVDSLFITMSKTKSSPQDFRLMGRGFHWINETPYNR
jgi:hypothetical protein